MSENICRFCDAIDVLDGVSSNLLSKGYIKSVLMKLKKGS